MILEQETFHKISVTELENLVFCYFCKIINIKAENEFLKDYYISNVDSFKDYQVVTNDLIDELLYSDEYIHDRIENIIWLLMMHDVLPETKLSYLISIK